MATIFIEIQHLELEILIINMDKEVEKTWQERGHKAWLELMVKIDHISLNWIEHACYLSVYGFIK